MVHPFASVDAPVPPPQEARMQRLERRVDVLEGVVAEIMTGFRDLTDRLERMRLTYDGQSKIVVDGMLEVHSRMARLAEQVNRIVSSDRSRITVDEGHNRKLRDLSLRLKQNAQASEEAKAKAHAADEKASHAITLSRRQVAGGVSGAAVLGSAIFEAIQWLSR